MALTRHPKARVVAGAEEDGSQEWNSAPRVQRWAAAEAARSAWVAEAAAQKPAVKGPREQEAVAVRGSLAELAAPALQPLNSTTRPLAWRLVAAVAAGVQSPLCLGRLRLAAEAAAHARHPLSSSECRRLAAEAEALQLAPPTVRGAVAVVAGHAQGESSVVAAVQQ